MAAASPLLGAAPASDGDCAAAARRNVADVHAVVRFLAGVAAAAFLALFAAFAIGICGADGHGSFALWSLFELPVAERQGWVLAPFALLCVLLCALAAKLRAVFAWREEIESEFFVSAFPKVRRVRGGALWLREKRIDFVHSALPEDFVAAVRLGSPAASRFLWLLSPNYLVYWFSVAMFAFVLGALGAHASGFILAATLWVGQKLCAGVLWLAVRVAAAHMGGLVSTFPASFYLTLRHAVVAILNPVIIFAVRAAFVELGSGSAEEKHAAFAAIVSGIYALCVGLFELSAWADVFELGPGDLVARVRGKFAPRRGPPPFDMGASLGNLPFAVTYPLVMCSSSPAILALGAAALPLCAWSLLRRFDLAHTRVAAGPAEAADEAGEAEAAGAGDAAEPRALRSERLALSSLQHGLSISVNLLFIVSTLLLAATDANFNFSNEGGQGGNNARLRMQRMKQDLSPLWLSVATGVGLLFTQALLGVMHRTREVRVPDDPTPQPLEAGAEPQPLNVDDVSHYLEDAVSRCLCRDVTADVRPKRRAQPRNQPPPPPAVFRGSPTESFNIYMWTVTGPDLLSGHVAGLLRRQHAAVRGFAAALAHLVSNVMDMTSLLVSFIFLYLFLYEAMLSCSLGPPESVQRCIDRGPSTPARVLGLLLATMLMGPSFSIVCLGLAGLVVYATLCCCRPSKIKQCLDVVERVI